MDEPYFRGVTNPARRRRLLLQHAAREARELAEAARLQLESMHGRGGDPDPELLNRATRLQRVIMAAAEIAEEKPSKRTGRSG